MAAFLAALPSVRFSFAGDDTLLIVENPGIHTLSAIPQLFTEDFFARPVAGVPKTGGIGYYRPLTKATFAVDWALWGRSAAGFHATQVAIHVGAALLFFLCLVELLGPTRWAYLWAIVFAAYPSHPQAVGLINARSDLLCALGMLLACLGSLKRRWAWIALGIAVSLFSKETGIFAAPLAALALWIRPERTKRLMPSIRACIITPLLILAFRSIAFRPDLPPSTHAHTSTSWFILAGQSLGAHLFALTGLATADLRLVLLPASPFSAAVLLGWIASLTLLMGAAYFTLRRDPRGLGLAWVALGLLQLLFVHRIQIPLPGVLVPLHERWTYIPSLGLCLFAAAASSSARAPRVWILTGLGAALIALYALRIEDYRDNRSMAMRELRQLRTTAPEHLPPPLRAKRWQMEGTLAAQAKEYSRALDLLQKSLTLDADNPVTLMNLASVYLETGSPRRAAMLLERSLAPQKVSTDGSVDTFVVDDALARNRPERYALLAYAYERLDYTNAAEKALRSALEGDPNNASYALNLGAFFARHHRWTEAKMAYVRATDISPCYKKALEALRTLASIEKDSISMARWNLSLQECGT